MNLATGPADFLGSHEVSLWVARELAANLSEAFPALGATGITHTWSGHIGGTFGGFPRAISVRLAAPGLGAMDVGLMATSLGRDMVRAVSGVQFSTLPASLHNIAWHMPRSIWPGYAVRTQWN